MRSPCASRVRVQPCCDPYTGSYGKKKVRINPVVERTTLLAPRSRQYMSDDYEGCRQSTTRRAESIGRRSRRCQSPLDSYSDVETTATNTYPYGLFAASEKSRRNYGSVRGNSRYVPCSQPASNHARMRSPQRERPLYDDEDDYIPRPQRIGQRAAMRPPCAPLYDNNSRNVIYHRKNHHFARGDTLTHKNLTRTYVFHRQPFDWYDSNQGVVLDDIEQILEPEDLFEPDDLPPPPPPPSQQQPIRTGRVPFVPRTVIYEQPVPMSNRSRPVERSTVVVPSVPSGGGGSIGGSNHFYDDVYVGSNLDTVSTGGEVTSRPSPPRNNPNQFVSDKDRPSAFRSPSNSSRYCDDVSKNSSPSSKNYFVIEKESSTPNGVKTTFRSSEFMSPPLVNEPTQKFNGLPRPGNQTDGRRATFDMSDDINRIMRKFDEIGINDKPKK